MSKTWSATAASYFSRVPKARVLEAVTEAVGAEEAGRIAGFKKGDMAEAAERLLEGRNWLPSVLRTAEALNDDMAQAGHDEEGAASSPEAYGFAAE
jgi:ParB family chromosome partitioning protein